VGRGGYSVGVRRGGCRVGRCCWFVCLFVLSSFCCCCRSLLRAVRFCFPCSHWLFPSFFAGCHPYFSFPCACCFFTPLLLAALARFSAGALPFAQRSRRGLGDSLLSAVAVCHPHAAPLRVISFRCFLWRHATLLMAHFLLHSRDLFAPHDLRLCESCSLRPCSLWRPLCVICVLFPPG
jgi:hypothetical protein